MNTPSQDTLREVVRLVREGRQDEANKLIKGYLKEHPDSADGWIAAHLTVKPIDQRIAMLRRALAIDPNHAYARKTLASLESQYSPLDALLAEPFAEPTERPAQAPRSNMTTLILLGAAASGLAVLLILSLVFILLRNANRNQNPTEAATSTADLAAIVTSVVVPTRTATATTQATATNSPTPMPPTDTPTPVPYERGTLYEVPFRIIDAEYSKSLNRVVVIAEDPNQLYLIDPTTLVTTAIPLKREPLVLALAPDGLKVAVGHAGLISYIDLQALTISNEFPLTTELVDLVLTNDGWIYMSSASGSRGVPLLTLNTATGEYAPMAGVEEIDDSYGRSPLVLHPDGKRLYGSDIGSSDSRLYSINVSGSQLTPHGKSRFEYSACDDISISEDGQYVFTCANAFATSDTPDDDLTYRGGLEDPDQFSVNSPVSHLTTSVAAGRILVAFGERGRVGVWEYPSRNWITWIELPTLLNENEREINTYGGWVFATLDGSSYIVIAQTQLGDPYSAPRSALMIGDMPGAAPAATATPAPSFSGPIRVLPFRLIDARYSLALDRIIAISSSPDQLHLIDPATMTDTTVDLSLKPNVLALSPDGVFAAVAHDGFVSYVDLRNAAVIKEILYPSTPADVVLPGNGWIYVSQNADASYPVLYALNIQSGEATIITSESIMVYAADNLEVHSNGRWLYTTSYVYDMRMDIGQDGLPYVSKERLFDFNSDIELCSDFWFSGDGQRVFTRCGDVLASTEALADDLKLLGQLGGEDDGFRWITALSASSRILGAQLRSNVIWVWDGSTFNLIQTYTIPDFEVDGLTIPATNRFVFTKSDGSEWYAIVQTGDEGDDYAYYGLFSGAIP